MSFTIKDLRYNIEASYPVLQSYLRHRAELALGSLRYDTDEVDMVVAHPIEYLVKLGVLGNSAPETAFDRLTEPQFYKFLNQTIKHKAIDRLRRRRLPVSPIAALQAPGDEDEEHDPLSEVQQSIWNTMPFRTPEETVDALVSTEELRKLLIDCIERLKVAPHQYQAVIQELKELDALALLHGIHADVPLEAPSEKNVSLTHMSQHKDHAHKKLRHCVQKSSTNLIVIIALRLTEYGVHSSTDPTLLSVDIDSLQRNEQNQSDLSEHEVRTGLKQLVAEGLLQWAGERVVHFTSVQAKRLGRFYEGE